MPLLLNDAPQRVLEIIYAEYPDLFDEISKEPFAKAWPTEVYLIQAEPIIYYAECLDQIIFAKSAASQHFKTKWQVRQTYRIINTCLSSEHPSLSPNIKDQLKKFKDQLENSTELKPLLEQIENGEINPDLMLSGHCGWFDDERFVDFPSVESSIDIYGPISGKLSHELAWDIENKCYDDRSVIIRNTQSNTYFFPQEPCQQTYNYASCDKLPNFGIQGRDDLKARLIETITGRILLEETKTIFLNDIVKQYPNRKIHLASCAVLINSDTKEKFGPYVDYKLCKLDSADLPEGEILKINYSSHGMFRKQKYNDSSYHLIDEKSPKKQKIL